MKVKVEVTLDIDVENWDLAYGTGTKASDVRADVKKHASNTLVDALDREGFLVGGAL